LSSKVKNQPKSSVGYLLIYLLQGTSTRTQRNFDFRVKAEKGVIQFLR